MDSNPLPPPAPRWQKALRLIPFALLVAWQGWMTLTLFGPDKPWQRLCDDEPVVSGRHPLHLYHGYLGARAFHDRGSLCCFDPGFQAGYPKTPVFDESSRPAELFLILGGGSYCPAAYKLGLAACCLAVPFLLATAAWAAGLRRVALWGATALGLLVWWGRPGREALEAGDLDLLLATLAALAMVGLLIHFDRAPGLGNWLGVLATGYLGWFAHPVFFALLLPLGLVYYLSVGARHGLAWHLALLLGLAGAVASNAFWLTDWVHYWWLRAPASGAAPVLSHRTWQTVWEAPAWGDGADRALGVALLAAGLVGVVLLNKSRQRPAARLLGLGAGGFVALAVAGQCWEPLGHMGASRLLVAGLLFAVLPALHAFHWAGCLFLRLIGPLRAATAAAVVLVAAGLFGRDQTAALVARCGGTRPLAISLGPERCAVLNVVQEQTTPEARILWEDRSGDRLSPRWTALLPVLTGRAYVGGLDPDAAIEHTHAGFADQVLAGRPLGSWSDDDLDRYCRRYNIGWVVCWSPAAVARLEAWKGAVGRADLHDGVSGRLFEVCRPRSYVLVGQAQWVQADAQRVTLGDVVPENGTVVLSLHHVTGLQAIPGRVRVERELDPNDPIPFVRLKVPGPMARVTLTWEKR